MKRTLLALVFLGFLFLSARFAYPFALRAVFLLSGAVAITPELARAAQPNTMLFLVASNEGGVPVAVKKIISPVFPVKFEMTSANLIMPDLLTRRLYLEAFLNTHGRLGAARRGDLKGGLRGRATVRSSGLDITLDTTEE